MNSPRTLCVLACWTLSARPTAVHDLRINGGALIVATVRAGGMELSLSTPRAPFFLSELLPLTVSLRNQSRAAIGYFGTFTSSFCGSALDVTTVASAPRYAPPYAVLPQCPAPLPHPSALAPGRAISVQLLVPVTASGHVSVTAHILFVTAAHDNGPGSWYSSGPGPFARRWPALTIDVAPRVPADRVIRLQPSRASFRIVAPPHARSSLLYEEESLCQSAWSITVDWSQLLDTHTIEAPPCTGPSRWLALVSAPGFAIASAMQ